MAKHTPKFMNKTAAKKELKFAKGSDVMGLSSNASWTKFKAENMLLEGFEGNSFVFACIRKKMQAAGSVPLVMQEKNDEGAFETVGVKENEISKVLNNVCPGLSQSQLNKVIMGQLEIQGEFYAKIVLGGRGNSKPLEIWPMPIASTRPVTKDNEVVKFVYTDKQGKNHDLSVDEVIHLRYTHPDSKFHGMAPMKAGGKAIDIDNEASDWQKISMENRGVPDGVFTMEGEDVGVDEWQELQDQVRENYLSKDSAREPWVLANASFKQLSQSFVDLDFIQGRKMTANEICSVMDVPPPLVGIYEDATLANIETARKIFWRDTMLPILQDIADQLTSHFKKFRARGDREFKLVYDTANVAALQESLDDKLESAKKMQSMGIPLSVINKRLELNLDTEAIDGSGVGYMPASMMPVTFSTESSDEGSESGRLTDEDFERLTNLASRVMAGDLDRESAVAMAVLGVQGIDEATARSIIQEPDDQGGEE